MWLDDSTESGTKLRRFCSNMQGKTINAQLQLYKFKCS